MHNFRARPLSRAEIREQAFQIRKRLKLENALMFPVLEVAEWVLPKIDSRYQFKVVDMQELGSSHGLTTNEDGFVTIEIREDVYERAYRGEGRDRGTVIHEVAHYFLHARSQGLHRNFSGAKLETYEDPEWQAKCFQGEILVPKHLVSGLNAMQVTSRCGVSLEAAEYQLRQYRRQ